MLKSYEIITTIPRPTQLERMEFKCLESLIMEDGKIRDNIPEPFLKRFEFLIVKFVEATQAHLN
jgi:hypothetical protein